MPTDPGVLTELLNNFLSVFSLGFGRIMPDARWLLSTLALIEVILAALWWAFKREDAVVAFLQHTLWIGFFIYLVTQWPTIVNVISDSFATVGLRAGGNALSLTDFLDPSQIAHLGVVATAPIFNHLGAWGFLTNNIADVIISGLSGLIILLAFFIMAIQVFITVLEFYIGAVLALILVPFGVNRHTAFMAERAFGLVIAFGIKLMVLGFITSATFPVLSAFTLPADPPLGEVFSMMLASLAIAFLMWHAPSMATGLLAGSPSLTAGTAVGTAVGTGLAAAGMSKALSGGARAAWNLSGQALNSLGSRSGMGGAVPAPAPTSKPSMLSLPPARVEAAFQRQLREGRVGGLLNPGHVAGQFAVRDADVGGVMRSSSGTDQYLPPAQRRIAGLLMAGFNGSRLGSSAEERNVKQAPEQEVHHGTAT